jgi:simple sugar transport system ATP-binding protein
LGDNGAGKSTAIKILSGVHRPDSGRLLIDGEEVSFESPSAAMDRGIATVFQDLAMIPLMPIVRSFFLGRELVRPSRLNRAVAAVSRGSLAAFDRRSGCEIVREEMAEVGIEIRDPYQPIGTLSGGERQAVAIARAAYFGARVLILDEPTSALGVREAAHVLRYVLKARARGLGIVFITHNVQHALAIGDEFAVLDHGAHVGNFRRSEVSQSELENLMAGGQGMDELTAELADLLAERDRNETP